IYWLAIQIKAGDYSLFIPQWFPYQPHDLITRIEAVSILLSFLELNHKEVISARTEICIVPGYKFKICTSLQTNFHQPKSTLLLLIAAIMGNSWRNLYEFALSEKLEFLSYGDTMFLEVK
ncbi:MAG: S-adenosylmethionine:tRNA ribosyltransferase-isomerase, partial [Bacteroidota bacterium]